MWVDSVCIGGDEELGGVNKDLRTAEDVSTLLVSASASRQLHFPSSFNFVCPRARSPVPFVIGFMFCWSGFRTAVSLAGGLRWFSDSCVGHRFTYAETPRR